MTNLLKADGLATGITKKWSLHSRNPNTLDDIIDTISDPTIDIAGNEAKEAAWLVFQHAIGQPDLMKKGAKLLRIAVNENRAAPKDLAFLTDRIADLTLL